MNTKQYEKLLALVMEKLEQTEIEKDWFKMENKQLKELVDSLKQKEDREQVMSKIKSQIKGG